MFPKRSQPYHEKSFKYGSVMAVTNLPNLVNFAPGIQVIKIAIKQKSVYMIIIAESKDKTVRIYAPCVLCGPSLLFKPDVLYINNLFKSVYSLLFCINMKLVVCFYDKRIISCVYMKIY